MNKPEKRPPKKADVIRYLEKMERVTKKESPQIDNDKYREFVLDWVRLNFEPGEVEVKIFPGVLPGAVTITDKDGAEMLCWWDILSEKVEYRIREDY